MIKNSGKILVFVFLFTVIFVSYNYYNKKTDQAFFEDIVTISPTELEKIIDPKELNTKLYNGYTLLNLVCELNKDLYNIDYLLEMGANPNIPNKNSMTPIMTSAALNDNIDVINLLIFAKADINLSDKNGMNAFNYAVAYNPKLEIIELLVARGANIQQKSKNGANAMFMAMDNPNHEVVDYVHSLGFDVNSVSDFGITPLMYAAYSSTNLKTIERLLKLGANVNAQSEDHSTALIYSIKNSNPEVSKLLLKYGADPQIRNKDGKNFTELQEQNSKKN